MKLSDYAKQVGISYCTALRWFKAGSIDGYQTATGTIIINQPSNHSASISKPKVAIYARVSSAENKTNLDSQADRLSAYCAAKGYQIATIVKEIGSGVNDTRPKFVKLLTDNSINIIVVEHKDRFSRFAFNAIEQLLLSQARKIEVVNLAENSKEDLMQDFVSIITSFCARIYGQRRAKRKTEKLIEELKQDAIS